jgi:phosphoribosylglycinamide formyltransferase-1
MNLAIFASHFGSTLQAVIDAAQLGKLAARPRLVISNNSDSEALKRARRANITALHLSSKTHPDPQALDRAIIGALEEHAIDCVVLAGYMKKLGPGVLSRYGGRIVNTHPALLPKFGGQGMYGERVHQAVLAAGEKQTGVTIHWVDEGYDTGAIIAQDCVDVLATDDVAALSARAQRLEKDLLVRTLDKLAKGELAFA